MEQKQRDKIAWTLIVVLVPLLIYLLITNIAKVRKKSLPQAPPLAAISMAPAGIPNTNIAPPNVIIPPLTQPASAVDPKTLAEQKRIAALLPKSNPFNPKWSAGAVPETTAPTPAAAPPATTLKLMAIVTRGSGLMAMINGRFFGKGDRVAGWTVLKVTATEVLLDNGAQKMVLKLR